MIPSCPVGTESGSICIGEEHQDGRGARVRKTRSALASRKRNHPSGSHYKIVINVLPLKDRSTLIGCMASKITLALGTALAAIAFCCFVESGLGQDALFASLDATENDDRDGEDKDDKD